LLFGHGWIFLAPNVPGESGLERTLRLADGQRVTVKIRYDDKIRVHGCSTVPLDISQRREVGLLCSRMLRLEDDLAEFHRRCEADATLRFVAAHRAGRLLRSPTVFEDVVKTICTTNCSWSNTKRMVAALCDLAGGVFPNAAELVQLGPDEIRRRTGAGYRAAYLCEFAARVASGELDPEAWLHDPWSDDRVFQTLRTIKGVGPYAARHVLMLLSRYDQIPVDSEVKKWLQRVHFRGRRVRESRLLARYERFAPWQFLAYKFERIGLRDNYIDS
jgi:3-methyladenine DNA glycosylase/8-oxoguanine DNA glycosylase